jgi:hypothetical protein
LHCHLIHPNSILNSVTATFYIRRDAMTDAAETGTGVTKNPAELTLEVYNLLLPYPELRLKVTQSAFVLFGESFQPQQTSNAPSIQAFGELGEFADISLGPKAAKWVQKHGISRAQLDEVFHLADGSFEVTASSVSGSSKREMTENCYLLLGLRGLLKTDISTLDDSEAIALCKRLTAYDKNNHTALRKSIGNKMTGTKPNFTLTGPGEIAAAELIKQMVSQTGG